MKNILSSLLICCSSLLFGQFGPQQIISTDILNASGAIPLDIDDNGTMDILATGGDPYIIGWFSNQDGQGTFGDFNLINNDPAVYNQIYFEDIDTDGDNDLLLLINNPRKLVWHENIDGQGTFGPRNIIIENYPDYLMSTQPIDIDNDGDLDIIARITNTFTDWIQWFENVDGTPNYADPITLLADPVKSYIGHPKMIDIDNDGLLDMLTAYENFNGPAHLVWYRNLGNTVFSEEIEIYVCDFIISDNTSIAGIGYVDINSDGLKDIAIVTHNDDFGTFYKWFQNIDNAGTFSEDMEMNNYGRFENLDNDNNVDLVKGSYLLNRIYWVEGNGNGVFNPERTITTEVDFIRYIGVADINNDGLPDVVSASSADNKIAWYENTGILGVEDLKIDSYILYPNPTSSNTHIFNVTSKISTLQIYNSSGMKIPIEWDENVVYTDWLPAGLYLIHIEMESGSNQSFKLLKE